jgi:hypothetical protein
MYACIQDNNMKYFFDNLSVTIKEWFQGVRKSA